MTVTSESYLIPFSVDPYPISREAANLEFFSHHRLELAVTILRINEILTIRINFGGKASFLQLSTFTFSHVVFISICYILQLSSRLSYEYMVPQFILCLVDGTLGCFQFLAIMNKASWRILIQVILGYSFHFFCVNISECNCRVREVVYVGLTRNYQTFETFVLVASNM